MSGVNEVSLGEVYMYVRILTFFQILPINLLFAIFYKCWVFYGTASIFSTLFTYSNIHIFVVLVNILVIINVDWPQARKYVFSSKTETLTRYTRRLVGKGEPSLRLVRYMHNRSNDHTASRTIKVSEEGLRISWDLGKLHGVYWSPWSKNRFTFDHTWTFKSLLFGQEHKTKSIKIKSTAYTSICLLYQPSCSQWQPNFPSSTVKVGSVCSTVGACEGLFVPYCDTAKGSGSAIPHTRLDLPSQELKG